MNDVIFAANTFDDFTKVNSKEYSKEFVVSAYLVRNDKVCLINHADLKKVLPLGGHISLKEDILSAVKREVLEESGWEIDIIADETFYYEPNFVWQIPPPRFVQYELIEEEGESPHIHVNLVYFCKALERKIVPDLNEGNINWYDMHDLDEIEDIFPHTRMNAISAIREVGSIIPDRLRPEKNRVLVPIGGRCKYECNYCYTKRHDVYFGEPNPQRTYEMLSKLCSESKEVLTAQIGYDNDPFINPKLGLDIITRLTWLPINIGFSTKAYISEETARRLALLRRIKLEEGYNLSGLITLTSIGSYSKLEPKAPTPERRLQSVRILSDKGIPILINLRPMLPDIVSEKEFQEVITRSKEAGALGIVFGAFWTDPKGIVIDGLTNPKITPSETKIPWAPHGLNWLRYEDEQLTKRLMEFCKILNLMAFDSSAEAVNYLNNKKR
ncbi:MAG: NUDIX domain-containing protein [Candidatus Zixiibacteriota bacterium]